MPGHVRRPYRGGLLAGSAPGTRRLEGALMSSECWNAPLWMLFALILAISLWTPASLSPRLEGSATINRIAPMAPIPPVPHAQRPQRKHTTHQERPRLIQVNWKWILVLLLVFCMQGVAGQQDGLEALVGGEGLLLVASFNIRRNWREITTLFSFTTASKWDVIMVQEVGRLQESSLGSIEVMARQAGYTTFWNLKTEAEVWAKVKQQAVAKLMAQMPSTTEDEQHAAQDSWQALPAPKWGIVDAGVRSGG